MSTSDSYCAHCGAANAAEATFCGGCGSPLGAAGPPSTAAFAAPPPSPAYLPPAPRKGPSLAVVGLAALGLVLLVAVAALLVPRLTGGSESARAAAGVATAATPPAAPAVATPQPAPVVTKTVEVQRTEVVPERGDRGSAGGWDHYRTTSISGYFSKAGTLTSSTTIGFAREVGEAYNRSGAGGGSTTVNAWSPTTKRWYDMWCESQGDGSVVCTGGVNARVHLWG